MLKIRVLERTSSSIVYELPSGKPNPELPCLEGVDERPRVKQKQNPSINCVYYALNYIRPRIGKKPTSKALDLARKSELICSRWRKGLRALDREFPLPFVELISDEARSLYGRLDLLKAGKFLKTGKSLEADKKDAVNGKSPITPLLQEFIQQKVYPDFYSFLRDKWAARQIKIDMGFLKVVNPPACALLKKAWKENNIHDLKIKMEGAKKLALSCLVDCYSLRHSEWHPDRGIQDLILKLKEKGPIVVFGYVGLNQYKEPPCALSMQIAERQIFGWKKNAPRIQDAEIGHSVLIVGAKHKEGIEQVYFIDPNDPSDPNDPTLQRIYAISYRNLRENMKTISSSGDLNPEIGYAYTGNFLIP